ncbi:MAG: hypothetical protein ACK5MT_12510 [Actinomycetales bacterium]
MGTFVVTLTGAAGTVRFSGVGVVDDADVGPANSSAHNGPFGHFSTAAGEIGLVDSEKYQP